MDYKQNPFVQTSVPEHPRKLIEAVNMMQGRSDGPGSALAEALAFANYDEVDQAELMLRLAQHSVNLAEAVNNHLRNQDLLLSERVEQVLASIAKYLP